MDELIEQLVAIAIPQTVPMDLPDEDLLVEIEEELLLPIPRSFKDFLLTVSNLVIGSLEPVTVSDPHAHTHLPEVTAEAWANGVPREVMVLCVSGEEYYCVNAEGEVVIWSDGEFTEESWENVWEWAEGIWMRS